MDTSRRRPCRVTEMLNYWFAVLLLKLIFRPGRMLKQVNLRAHGLREYDRQEKLAGKQRYPQTEGIPCKEWATASSTQMPWNNSWILSQMDTIFLCFTGPRQQFIIFIMWTLESREICSEWMAMNFQSASPILYCSLPNSLIGMGWWFQTLRCGPVHPL